MWLRGHSAINCEVLHTSRSFSGEHNGVKCRQLEAGVNKRERKVWRSQIRSKGPGAKFPVSHGQASLPSPCGVCVASMTRRIQDAPSLLPAPSSWPRACLVALLSCGQVQVTTESPLRLRCRLLRPLHLFLSTVGWTGARRASGEVLAVLGGSPAVTLQSMLQSLGPGSHLGTSRSELRWGLEPRGLQGERKCRRECVQPPKCRAAGKG